MHIRAFVLGCAASLAMLALAPAAMADPAPDTCVLDLSQPATIDHALDAAEITCDALTIDVAAAAPIAGGDDDEAAFTSMIMAPATFAPTGHRQHEDPGRCLG